MQHVPLVASRVDPPGWYVVCRSRELRRRPRAVRIGSRHLVAFRTAAGEVAVLDDRCAHRGMPLSAGRVDGDCVRCPYHGWAYDRAGSVRDMPALQHDPAALGAACSTSGGPRVGALDCVEQQGVVWARLGAAAAATPAATTAWAAAAAPHRFRHAGERGWTTFSMHTLFRSTVEACLENFLDCPHATFVHEHWFRARTARPVRCVVRTLADGAAAEFFDEPREKSAVWWLLAPKRGRLRHVDRFVSPNTSEVEYEFAGGLHYVITSTCTPHERDTTLVHTVISYRAPRWAPVIRLVFEPLSRLILRQDVRTLARRQDNPARGQGAPFVDTPADLLGPHIRDWRRAALAGTPPPATGAETHARISL